MAHCRIHLAIRKISENCNHRDEVAASVAFFFFSACMMLQTCPAVTFPLSKAARVSTACFWTDLFSKTLSPVEWES